MMAPALLSITRAALSILDGAPGPASLFRSGEQPAARVVAVVFRPRRTTGGVSVAPQRKVVAAAAATETAPAARGHSEVATPFMEEMRAAAMRLHSRDQGGRKDAPMEPPVDKWQPTVEGYLQFLVDSKLVFETLEAIVDRAAVPWLEKVEVRRPRSLAKIFGTAICVSGAMSMAFFKGPKLLLLGDLHALLHSPAGGRWVAGALFLVGSSSCWSLWLILQVPICKSFVDPLALSAWMCLLSTLQSALLVSFLLPDPTAWRIHSFFELSCCLFSGVFGSGVTFYLQSWCISVRGPLYSAMFNPLCTVITTVFATAVLCEELHVGSLLGAIAVIAGLYVVLWGKAGDAKMGGGMEPVQQHSDDDLKMSSARSDSTVDGGSGITAPLLAGGDPTEK